MTFWNEEHHGAQWQNRALEMEQQKKNYVYEQFKKNELNYN